jgi:hypothetical protein
MGSSNNAAMIIFFMFVYLNISTQIMLKNTPENMSVTIISHMETRI